MEQSTLIIIGIFLAIIIYIIVVYNGLVARRAQSREAWSTIDTQLKRRYDLIPNLIATVKGAVKHESETLKAVTAARTAAMGAQGAGQKSGAENQLTDALKSIFAVAESYPTLRANENFLELQREITNTETRIQAARQFYNTVVMGLNAKIDQFPSNVIAGIFKIGKESFFELDAAEKIAVKKSPKVDFS